MGTGIWKHVRTRAAFLAALVFAHPAVAAGQAGGVLEVTVTGKSSRSFEEAKEDALRRAVEMGGGKLIASRTQIRDFRLVHDTIISRSVGYVQTYTPLSQGEANGLYEVTIRAEVSTARIEADWGAIEILIERKGRPNLLVVVEEDTQWTGSTGNRAEYQLRDLFDKLGFDLVDDEALAKAGDRDRLRAEIAGDERKAAAIAAQLHAGYAVTGRAHVRAGLPQTVYGITSTPVSVDLDVKIVVADTARLLASKSASAKRASRDPVSAAREALQMAAEDVGQQAIYRMLEHWARDLDAGGQVLLLGTRIDTKVLNAFVDRLNQLEGLKSVTVIDHNAEMTTVKVVTRLKTASLAKEIPMLSGERLAVTGYSGNRVEFTMKAETHKAPNNKQAPPAPASQGQQPR